MSIEQIKTWPLYDSDGTGVAILSETAAGVFRLTIYQHGQSIHFAGKNLNQLAKVLSETSETVREIRNTRW